MNDRVNVHLPLETIPAIRAASPSTLQPRSLPGSQLDDRGTRIGTGKRRGLTRNPQMKSMCGDRLAVDVSLPSQQDVYPVDVRPTSIRERIPANRICENVSPGIPDQQRVEMLSRQKGGGKYSRDKKQGAKTVHHHARPFWIPDSVCG